MSQVKISGDASGTGILTIAAPNTNSNFTLTLPQSTTTVVGTDATQTLTNKTLTSPTLTTPNVNSAQVDTVSGTAPLYFARAWVNFNGTGTVAIRASGNVTSITDNGTGDYTVNFTSLMPDANYAAISTTEADSTADNRYIAPLKFNARTTSSVGVFGALSNTNVKIDIAYIAVAIFR